MDYRRLHTGPRRSSIPQKNARKVDAPSSRNASPISPSTASIASRVSDEAAAGIMVLGRPSVPASGFGRAVLVGTALAVHDGFFDGPRFVLTLLGSLLVQIGTNLVDEYAHHVKGGGQGKLLAPYKVI